MPKMRANSHEYGEVATKTTAAASINLRAVSDVARLDVACVAMSKRSTLQGRWRVGKGRSR